MSSNRPRCAQPSGVSTSTPSERAQAVLRVSPEEWQIITTAHPNLLIEGAESLNDATNVALTPFLRAPIHYWEPGIRFRAPRHHKGSLVLRDIAKLTPDEQIEALDWMDTAMGSGQTVALSPAPIFPLIAAGRFNVNLYYRVNMLRLDLDATLR